jgi:hypothetical protein
MPGYGIAGADEGSGLLDWSWAAQRLTEARNYWVGPSGRPAGRTTEASDPVIED